jgi:hypothetical protein
MNSDSDLRVTVPWQACDKSRIYSPNRALPSAEKCGYKNCISPDYIYVII